jgi:nitrogen regulatory protein PII 1
MVRAIVRPESADSIADKLSDAGFVSLTKIPVFGRGKQKGISIGTVRYDELSKTLLMVVIEDKDVDAVTDIIKASAYTGNFGDGKIFVSPVEKVYTVRTNAVQL